MRLWHQELIPYLSKDHLSGQHRECAALRGGGWNKRHSVVDYVFQYSPRRLYDYHMLIIHEYERRGANIAQAWKDPDFRGWIKVKSLNPFGKDLIVNEVERERWASSKIIPVAYQGTIYPEHNSTYLLECLQNIKSKGLRLRRDNPFDFDWE